MLFETQFKKLLLVAFTIIGLLAAFDVVIDIRDGMSILHISIEIVVLVISISSAFSLFFRLLKETQRARNLVQELTEDLEINRQQAETWKQENHSLLQGLSSSIDKQFEQWQLTQSEKEIALFLLKGLSHKEIAIMRNVSEATTRQQARVVYQKAELTGRHDLSAFFLEDLALPIKNN